MGELNPLWVKEASAYFLYKATNELDINHSKPAAPFYHQVRIVLYHTLQG